VRNDQAAGFIEWMLGDCGKRSQTSSTPDEILALARSGCIGLRDLAESIQRSFPGISDYSRGKVQRIGCEYYSQV